MQFITSITLALASASAVIAAATPVSMPPLSDYVKRDLLSRDPSTYQTFDLTNGSSLHLNSRAAPGGKNGLLTRCTSSSCFGLTFDDGPYTDHKFVADTVNNAGYKATFFVNGNNYGCIYDQSNVDRLRYSYAQGHQICSHTWGHVHLNQMSNSQIDRQVQLVEDALYKIIGAVPACIRPPFGEANDRVVSYLNSKGLAVINWTHDSGDSAEPMASVQSQLNQYRSFKAPKHVVMLQHEVYSRTARQVIPQAVQILKNNGYQSSAVQGVGKLFGFNAYKVVGQRGTRDASWTCQGKPAPGQG